MADHYYTEDPVSKIIEKNFSQSIKGITLTFTTVSGVFSFENKVDRASELLIKNFTPSSCPAGNNILDLGCGYGAIGLYLAALYPDRDITMVDINNRAVDYTRKNANFNKLKVEVLASDLFSSLSGRYFADIVSNPPIAAGKQLNLKLISECFDHIKPEGALWLVAHHNKGGSYLKAKMLEQFGNVEDIVKSGGVRVYHSVKKVL
jgi:16S rRNA (guanine1207-N2)-methyltransferase